MRLIVLYGMPAAGKLTVAQELKAITGLPLFHNHLVVDLLLSTFEFGSAPFVELREEIWLSFFREAARAKQPGLIFTFAPEATVRATFIPTLVETVQGEGGTVEFAELVCPLDEIRRRIAEPSRREYGKLASVELFEEMHAARSFDVLVMPTPKITVDTSTCTPAETARAIARAFKLA
ncbi:P-loop NTPase family protein [Terracidiphilus gabretensis]|uniref:AAA family ATPase n=1 Tax=Terracidiphilus gabretensis TaxID=1577687 RepID=UPI00071C16B1|nr:AAA family ATPase [Terracidiphilus gabretensis]